MLEGLLLLNSIVMVMRVQCIDIQRHVPCDTAASRETSLRVDDRVAALGSLNQVWILFFEETEVLLGFPVPWAVGSEEQVHFLKGTLARLGIESPDHGNGDDVSSSKDVVGLLVECLEHDRAEESEPSVTDRPSNDTPGITLSTDLEREDLSRVEPGDSQPGGAERSSEEEDHSYSAGAIAFSRGGTEGLILTRAGETTSEEHSNTLDDRSPVESPATADTVESEDTDEGSKHVGDGIETGDPLDLRVADTSGTEDGGSVDGYTSNTNPFLHDLEPNDKLNATTRVKFAGADTKEHSKVGLSLRRLAFELGNVADVLELGFGLAQIVSSLTAKATEDVAGLFLTTDFSEPTWRLGEKPDDSEEEQEWDNLESNGESPDE